MLKNQPQDLQLESDKYNSIYRAVVENNNDPLKAGRCQVRIWGLHTSKKSKSEAEGIPTEELPWAEPALPIMEGSISGMGQWNVPLQGSHVFLFFENGDHMQPRFFATVPGIPETTPSSDTGFSDPDGEYPLSHRVGEPDFHRLGRGISDSTIVDIKTDAKITSIPKSDSSTWDEPSPYYAAEYPHNTVIVTHGGNTIENDSTPNKQRIHIWHPSNTFIEIDVEGNVVVKNEGNKFEICKKTKNVYIMVDENTTVDKNRTHYVKEDENKKVDGSRKKEIVEDEDVIIGKNRTEEVKGNEKVTITGNETKNITGNKTDSITGNETRDVTGNKTDSITGNKTDSITGNWTISVTGLTTINATGPLAINATATCTVTSPATTLTGGTVTVAGAVPPTGVGSLCGIQKCLFTGANHVGSTAVGT